MSTGLRVLSDDLAERLLLLHQRPGTGHIAFLQQG